MFNRFKAGDILIPTDQAAAEALKRFQVPVSLDGTYVYHNFEENTGYIDITCISKSDESNWINKHIWVAYPRWFKRKERKKAVMEPEDV